FYQVLKTNHLLQQSAFINAKSGDLHRLQQLLIEGVSLNAFSLEGNLNSLLYTAAEAGQIEIVRFLLDQGAIKTLINFREGKYPLDIAREKGFEEIVSLLSRLEVPEEVQTLFNEVERLFTVYRSQRGVDMKYIDEMQRYLASTKASMQPDTYRPEEEEKILSELQKSREILQPLTVPDRVEGPDVPPLIAPEHFDELILQAPLAMLEEKMRERVDHYVGQGERAFQVQLDAFRNKGYAMFTEQLQQQETNFAIRLESYQTQTNQTIIAKQREQYQRALTAVLQSHRVTQSESISPELMTKIQQEITARVGPSLQQEITDLVKSQECQAQVREIQDTIITRIKERQGQLVNEMMQAQVRQEQIKDKQNVLYVQYENKQRKIDEQKKLYAHDAVRTFYTTIEQVFGAKLMSAMMLAEGMVKREESKGEKAGAVASGLIGGLCEGIPIVGGIVGTVASFAIEECTGAVAGTIQDNRMANTQDSIIRFKDAMSLAELAARRVAQSYEKHIKESYLSEDHAKEAGEKAAKLLYKFIKKGNLKDHAHKPIEEKIALLVNEVHRAGCTSTGMISKSGGIFKRTVQPAPIAPPTMSSATGVHLREMDHTIERFGDRLDLGSTFADVTRSRLITSLSSEKEMGEALGRFHMNVDSILAKKLQFQVVREKKTFKLQCEQATQETLRALARGLSGLFDKVILDDVYVNSNTLIIETKSTIVGDDFKLFLIKSKISFKNELE
ncbi:MAG: hypothetical protein K940chlam7_00321, partial [Chlamydiae bacterium]|nr:hypothetical protein [Chlamydiota bacterium]